MKSLKKNQIVIYVIALMLVVAGYLNYTTNSNKVVETGVIASEKVEDEELGDAKLVSNNNVINEDINQDNVTIKSKGNTVSTDEETLANTENEDVSMQSKNIDTKSDTKETASEAIDNYFENSKLERNQMYSQMLETYENMLKNEGISETQKAIATEEITKINNTKNAIMICENLISTKGFEQNIIFVNNESVNIVVKSDELQADEIAQIQNIIAREMKVEIENIHIMNK